MPTKSLESLEGKREEQNIINWTKAKQRLIINYTLVYIYIYVCILSYDTIDSIHIITLY
jgi:hypothetical protein